MPEDLDESMLTRKATAVAQTEPSEKWRLGDARWGRRWGTFCETLPLHPKYYLDMQHDADRRTVAAGRRK